MSLRQSSIFSLGSSGVTSKQNELCYDDMSQTELQQALESVACSNLLLRLENHVFERYLARRDPESLQSIQQSLETAKRIRRIASQQGAMSPVSSITESVTNIRDKGSRSIASIQSESQIITPGLLGARTLREGMKITYAQRIEMVNTEIRDLLREFTEFERTMTRKRTHLRAEMEEAEIRIREVRGTKEEFEEIVVRRGVDSITGKIPAEKFIRFVEESLKTIDSVIERVRLKAATIKSQIKKARLQLKQREELGEALRAVDFEQLKIENQDCIRKIDKKNQYLLEMKTIAGRYSIALTKHKEKVGALVTAMSDVRNKIIAKKQEFSKLRSEHAVMNIELAKAEKQLRSLMTLMDDFSVPDVMDFVKMHAELQELRRIHKRISRQRKIQQIMFKSNKQQS